MRPTVFCALALVALMAVAGGTPARGEGPTGLDVPIGDPSRSDQEYVWISNASNLPLFVERVYPGLEFGAQGAQRQRAHRRARRRSTWRRSSPRSTPSAPRTRRA